LSCERDRDRFIVDANVGKLARWLRMLGYDTLFSSDIDDSELVRIGLREKRVIVTRDTQIMRRRVVADGRARAILITDDDPRTQFRYLAEKLHLDREMQFTRCLECNRLLDRRSKAEVEGLVPPYVFKTQDQYYQCPGCQRIYWRATHWRHMTQELDELIGDKQQEVST